MRMKAYSAFVRATGVVVLYAVPPKNPEAPVIHTDRNVYVYLPLGLLEDSKYLRQASLVIGICDLGFERLRRLLQLFQRTDKWIYFHIFIPPVLFVLPVLF